MNDAERYDKAGSVRSDGQTKRLAVIFAGHKNYWMVDRLAERCVAD